MPSGCGIFASSSILEEILTIPRDKRLRDRPRAHDDVIFL